MIITKDGSKSKTHLFLFQITASIKFFSLTSFIAWLFIARKSQQVNEVDEIVKGLQRTPGFKAYLVLNNDGVVLRWDQNGDSSMPYEKAVQYAHHVLDLCDKSKVQLKGLFDDGDDQVESIRVRTDCHELILAQEGNYILVIIYEGSMHDTKSPVENDTESK